MLLESDLIRYAKWIELLSPHVMELNVNFTILKLTNVPLPTYNKCKGTPLKM